MTQVLLFTPVRDGYAAQMGYNVIETSLDGRKLKKSRDILWNPHILTVNWVLTSPTQYTQFMGFFRTNLKNGHLSFLMDLVTDIGVTTTHKCRSIQGMPKLSSVKSLSYYVQCTIEAEANPTYTGLITYAGLTIEFGTSKPDLTQGFRPGDSIRICDSTGTHTSGTALNLDGVYTVVSTTGTDLVTITPGNAQWTVLAGLSPAIYGDATHGNVTSTVTRVPT